MNGALSVVFGNPLFGKPQAGFEKWLGN